MLEHSPISPSLLRLLQLSSPALPTGGFAYSQGLESMLTLGWLDGETQCTEHLRSLMGATLVPLELPCVHRLHEAALSGDGATVTRWSRWLYATRESGEFQAQERQMARALARVMRELRPNAWGESIPLTYAEAFARAAVLFALNSEACLLGYAYVWCESHVAALAKLLPLGPIAGQRLLDGLIARIPEAVAAAYHISDDAIGTSTAGLALASALHEHQHTRIFRS